MNEEKKECPYCRSGEHHAQGNIEFLKPKKYYTLKCDICKSSFRSDRSYETPICDNCDARYSGS
jgi:hypothetical protein